MESRERLSLMTGLLCQKYVRAVALLGASLFASVAGAAPVLEFTQRLSWDVVGLDSNDAPGSGPDTFPVGYRVCNTGDQVAVDTVGRFYWDSANTYIDFTNPGNDVAAMGDIEAGECYELYFDVTVTRDPAAVDTARSYHLGVSANGVAEVTTPIDGQSRNEIYVEGLISQNRNRILSISGPDTVYVGSTYQVILEGITAPNGYEQLETFLTLPGDMFRVISIAASYATGQLGDSVYYDACDWDHDADSPDYLDCTGSGTVGDLTTLTYQIEVIATGTTDVTALIYDKSGASFHYNTDYGDVSLTMTALPPPVAPPPIDPPPVDPPPVDPPPVDPPPIDPPPVDPPPADPPQSAGPPVVTTQPPVAVPANGVMSLLIMFLALAGVGACSLSQHLRGSKSSCCSH